MRVFPPMQVLICSTHLHPLLHRGDNNHPQTGAPGGFACITSKHASAGATAHVPVNNKDLSLALAGRILKVLDTLPLPLLISCR